MPYSAKLRPTQELVVLALLLALAVVLRLAENSLPLTLPVIGARLGLANSITITAIYLFSLRQTAWLVIARVLLAGLLGGSLFSPGFFIGASGAALSLAAMAVGFYSKQFSPVGIGLLGAASHNCGQFLAAALLMQSSSIFSYLPLLLLVSLPTGLATGTIAIQALRLLPVKPAKMFA